MGGRKQQKEDRLEEARRQLTEHLSRKGLRWTRQREVVLSVFLDAAAHLSVEELYDRVRAVHPELGHATVYRCMSLFAEAGVAKERRFNEGRVRYEPAVAVDHHDHLICTQCGDIQEFEDERIERFQEEIAKGRGFTVTFHRLELYGLCPRCRE